MNKSNMRSRSLIDLNYYEIEQYLKRNDIIIIPVGTVENHAFLPVDAEGVQAEAWARLIAEKVDGLFLPNVTYFNPGGTQACRATVHMSMKESFRYCLELGRNLLRQGFKRQVWIPAHAPTEAFLMPMITQLFDETKQSMLYLDVHTYLANLGILPYHFMGKCDAVIPPAHPIDINIDMETSTIAAYKICGRFQAIPARDECDLAEYPQNAETDEKHWWPRYDRLLYKCSRVGTPAPFYYSKPEDHIGFAFPKYTRKQLEEKADLGVRYMQKLVDVGHFDELMEDLRALNEYIRSNVLSTQEQHLPLG